MTVAKKSNVSVIVDSRYGSTLALAKAIAQGAADEGALTTPDAHPTGRCWIH